MKRTTAIAAAIAGIFVFGVMSERAMADPCEQMKQEIAKLRHKADKARRKWTEYATYGYAGGTKVSNGIDTYLAGKGFKKMVQGDKDPPMSIHDLQMQAARYQAEADALEREMRHSRNCGEGRMAHKHNNGPEIEWGGGPAITFGGPGPDDGWDGPGWGGSGWGGPGKHNHNQGGMPRKKKKKGGMNGGGGCAC
jgi:hypothetical protein